MIHKNTQNLGESGHTPPCVPENTRIYAIGDIHGRFDLLQDLLSRIRKHRQCAMTEQAITRTVIVFLGDFIDRGPDSADTLDLLCDGVDKWIGEACECVFLRGNHEQLLLSFLAGKSSATVWRANGGETTLQSYGVQAEKLHGAVLRREILHAIPDRHLALIRSTSFMHIEGDYVFAHAGVRPGTAIAEQTPHDLMWIRREFLDSDETFGKIVVHGHSIRPTPEKRHNRIGIDTGAWQSGVLTALVLEGDQSSFVATPAPRHV